MMDEKDIKSYLLQKLKDENCFWSYSEVSAEDVDDATLIEKTMRHLDIDEINLLFKLFPYSMIKRVWLDRLVPEGEYVFALNRLFAWYYFNAKKPSSYVRAMATRHFNRNFT